MNTFTALLAILLALQILDGYTTVKGIKLGGGEGNPIMAKLISKFGLAQTLIIKGAVVMAIGYKAGLNGLIWLQMIIVIYVAVVIWNFRQIRAIKERIKDRLYK